MLFSGCWATRLPPNVYAKIFNFIVSGFCAPKRSFMSLAQTRRAAELSYLFKNIDAGQKRPDLSGKLINVRAAAADFIDIRKTSAR